MTINEYSKTRHLFQQMLCKIIAIGLPLQPSFPVWGGIKITEASVNLFLNDVNKQFYHPLAQLIKGKKYDPISFVIK